MSILNLKSLFILLFLFSDRITEGADGLAELKILAVREGGEVGAGKVKASLLVNQRLVNRRGNDIGNEHIVRALRNDLAELAFEGQRRLGDRGRGDLEALFCRKTAFFELIDLSARQHTAGIGGANEVHGSQIDTKFASLLDNFIGMARRTHRNIERGRVGRDNSTPRDRDRVRLFTLAGTAYYYSGQGREKCAALPFLF